MSAARETIETVGTVREALPRGLYRVELREQTPRSVVAHVGGGGALLRLLPGDVVVVELSAFDTTRGRIVRKRS
jgi:translation initiation factor IF-1